MKNLVLKCFAASALFWGGLEVAAQETLVAERGESVVLKSAEGYDHYQWQVSSDLENFVDLPEGDQAELTLKVFGPNYYRVKSEDGQGKTLYHDTVLVSLTPVEYAAGFSTTGGAHGYVETLDGRTSAKGIEVPEDRKGELSLTHWTDGNARVAYYIHHPQDLVDTEMYVRANPYSKVSFRISVWDPHQLDEPLAVNYVAFRGNGSLQHFQMMGLELPRSDYFRYQVECLAGWKNIMEIKKYHHYSPSALKSYKSDALMSPSVHLSFQTTEQGAASVANNDWCYQEVMMPEEADIPGTFIMSLGVLDGYMGIQMNGWKDGEPLHDVIFSMWDHGDTEADPNLPEHLRANFLDCGEGVVPRRFGGEGTGMQSFKRGNHWKCGTYVQFITNSRKETATYKEVRDGKVVVHRQKNTLVSAWYNAQDGKGWQYLSTLRLPKKTTFFGSWYSFLEDYNPTNGQQVRKGYYRNGYAHNRSTGRWVYHNKVSFTHTDGGDRVGARNDYGQGASDKEEDAFFMQSGGFLPTLLKSDEVPMATQSLAVDTIQLEVLKARVDLAIQHEAERLAEEEKFNQEKLDKKQWTLVDFSTEEVHGEGSNGRAAQIMDDDVNTYWHSGWTAGGAKCPHVFTIDLNDMYELSGMRVLMSGGSNRFIKSFQVFVNDNPNEAWKEVYQEEEAPNQPSFRFHFPPGTTGRRVRFQINASRADDGDHVRINEIDIAGHPMTGIGAVNAESQPLEVRCGEGEVLVKANETLPGLRLSLYQADGSRCYGASFEGLSAQKTVRIPMHSALPGTYVVAAQWGTAQISLPIVWR